MRDPKCNRVSFAVRQELDTFHNSTRSTKHVHKQACSPPDSDVPGFGTHFAKHLSVMTVTSSTTRKMRANRKIYQTRYQHFPQSSHCTALRPLHICKLSCQRDQDERSNKYETYNTTHPASFPAGFRRASAPLRSPLGPGTGRLPYSHRHRHRSSSWRHTPPVHDAGIVLVHT
jgi:hypothetical protein